LETPLTTPSAFFSKWFFPSRFQETLSVWSPTLSALPLPGAFFSFCYAFFFKILVFCYNPPPSFCAHPNTLTDSPPRPLPFFYPSGFVADLSEKAPSPPPFFFGLFRPTLCPGPPLPMGLRAFPPFSLARFRRPPTAFACFLGVCAILQDGCPVGRWRLFRFPDFCGRFFDLFDGSLALRFDVTDFFFPCTPATPPFVIFPKSFGARGFLSISFVNETLRLFLPPCHFARCPILSHYKVSFFLINPPPFVNVFPLEARVHSRN